MMPMPPGMNKIFIPGEVPSSKRGKQWTGTRLISSSFTRRYEAASWMDYIANSRTFHEAVTGRTKPLKIGFEFIRRTKGRFDYHNLIQCPMDQMVKAGWIADDSANEVIPFFLPYKLDKENPGVWIHVA
jgi:Holliday junction resolvase RusA-like endonuclease